MEYQDTAQAMAALGDLPARPELEEGYKDVDSAAGGRARKPTKAAVTAVLDMCEGGRGKL